MPVAAYRVLSNAIHRYLLDPGMLPTALRNLRGALFPNNAQGTPSLFPPSSDQELLALKRRCASALWAHLIVPRAVGRLYFGGSAASWLAAWWRGDGTNSSSRHCSSQGATAVASSSGAAGVATTGTGETDYLAAKPLRRSGPKAMAMAMTNNIHDGTGAGAGSSADAKEKDRDQDVGWEEKQGEADDLDARILTGIESDILDVFSDAYCNKHLMYGALELVLVRLLPELAEKGITELWEERLS